MPNSVEKKKIPIHVIFYRFLYGLSFALLLYLAYSGLSYYSTPYDKRPRHIDYSMLKPAGTEGHAYGIIGSLMMLLMLLYSVRKRTKILGKFGSLSSWLDIHIYFGVIGPLLVVLHTSFKVQGLVAVSFWSMIAVALSGVLGRYLYLQIPRDFKGEELSARDMDRMKDELTQKLKDEVRLEKTQMETIEKELAANISAESGLVGSLWYLVTDDLLRPIRVRTLKRRYSAKLNLPRELYSQIFRIFLDRSLLNRKIALLNRIQTLFHYWHVFHKPFAFIMYLIMIVHVVVAVWLGYVWIF